MTDTSSSSSSSAAATTTKKIFSDAFTFLPRGAAIQEFLVNNKNITLGFPSAAGYTSHPSNPFFGANIGRVCNRISKARIENLNGRRYELEANNGPNTLHGGVRGFDKREWEGPRVGVREGREVVGFRYVSGDGEEGFPGTVEVRLWYFPGVEVVEGREMTTLEIEYEAELVGSEVEETVVSLTNHSYFNISDGPTIEGTRATVSTNLHLPVDDTAIPTGTIEPYPEFSANEEFILGATTPDPDHCFIMNPDPSSIPLDTRKESLRKLVELSHPNTKIHFEALSTEPAFQFYTGRFINVEEGFGAPRRGPRSGLCIEASRYVNAVNREEWKGQVLLRKGEVWGSRTVYRAWVE